MITRIHVNQHVIKANRKNGDNEAPLTVKTYKSNTPAHNVQIKDDAGRVVASIIYRPDKPLSCGAHVWIETDMEVAFA